MSKQSVTGDDMREDEGAYDDEGVVGSIAEKLAALGGEEEETEDTEEEEIKEEEEEKTEETEEEKEEETQEEEEETKEEEAPEIPDNLLRAAEHVGWKPEDVVAFWKTDPERAQSTFENIHKSVNTLSQQFASVGRTALTNRSKANEPQQMAQAQEQTEDFIDVKKLREQYPDSELVDVVAGMNDALKKVITSRQPQATVDAGAVERAALQERMANLQTMNSFFGSDAMKSYAGYYGPVNDENGIPQFDWSYLEPGQMANRHAMLQTAEQILAGAEMQGQQMPVEQALTMAHLLQTAAMQKQNVRRELLAEVKKRSKGATLKPQAKKVKKKVNKEQELVNKVQQKLDKLS